MWIAYGIAGLMLLISLPLLGTLWGQLGLIVPGTAEPLPAGIRRGAENAVLNDPQIRTVHDAMGYVMLGIPGFPLARAPVMDPGNGLYANLELLNTLRANAGRAATRPASAPADAQAAAEESAALVHRLEMAVELPALKLYRQEQHDAVIQALVDVPARRAEVEAQYIAARAGLLHVPFLHEFSRRLLDQAQAWDDQGQAIYARMARRHLIRILREAAMESPRPDVVLPAAEESAVAWRAMGKPEVAARLEDLRERWHAAADDHRINLLPHAGPMLGDAVMAPRYHDRAVIAMLTVAFSGLGVLVLWGLALIAGSVALVTAPPVDILRTWRPRAWQAIAAACLLVCGPVLLAIVVLLTVDLPLAWLLSYPSLPSLLLPLLALPPMAGLAARVCTAPAKAVPVLDTGRKAAVVLAMGLGLLALLALLLSPEAASWSPPGKIQHLRSLGRWFAPVLVGSSLIWLVAGLVMRFYTARPVGVVARSYLRVLAPALLLMSAVFLAALIANQVTDRAHQQAYARAAADPVTDRLGPGWRGAFASP